MFIQSVLWGILAALPSAQTSKDEFVFNNAAEVETIDPQISTGVPDNHIVVNLFEGLMDRKADWVSLTPGQAESYKISKDLKTYTFKIRANAKWSDGSALTARDFEYAWLRAIDPKTLSQYSSWLTDNIAGAAEYAKSASPENAKKVGIKVIDDRTLQVTLNKPVPYFLELTAEAVMYPVKKEVVEKFGDKWTRPENIVVNGPYKLTAWKVQDKMILEKNPNYWNASAVKLTKIVALPIEDRQTGVNLFKQGKIDWTGNNGAPNSLVPNFKADPSFRIHPGFITYIYWFNTSRPPLNDKRVRQALALALDRKEIVDKITRGGEFSALTFVPPHTGKYTSPAGVVTANHAEDVKKAKKLLAEAGFPDGKGMRPLNLQYNTDENHKRLAQAVSQMWKKELGITVQPFNQEWKVYLKTQEAMDFDISRGGWQGDYPDPGTFLELLTSSSGNNHTLWKSKKYDELFEKANSTIDSAKRNKLLAEAEAMLLDEVPITPVFTYTNFGFLRPEIVGFKPNLIDRPYVKYFSKQ